MNNKTTHIINYLRWSIFSLLMLLLCFVSYLDAILKTNSYGLIILVVLLAILYIIVQKYYTRLLLKTNVLKRFGKLPKVNFLSIFQLILGFLFLFLAYISYRENTIIGSKFAVSVLWFLIVIIQFDNYYIVINHKKISKQNYDSIKLNEIISIEAIDGIVIIKSKSKRIEIFLEELTEYEKKCLFEEFEIIKNRNSL
jgi:hypothetical protein